MGTSSLRIAMPKHSSLRGAAAALGFLPSGLIGYGVSGLMLSEISAVTKGTIVTIAEIASVVLLGALGALVASLLFMRFVERRDFGQVQRHP